MSLRDFDDRSTYKVVVSRDQMYSIWPADRETPTGLAWPAGVHSLSHVALPFSPDDPLYGVSEGRPSPGIRLGAVALRGERGVVPIPAADMLRLRWNPFYPYLEERLVDFFQLAPLPGTGREIDAEAGGKGPAEDAGPGGGRDAEDSGAAPNPDYPVFSERD